MLVKSISNLIFVSLNGLGNKWHVLNCSEVPAPSLPYDILFISSPKYVLKGDDKMWSITDSFYIKSYITNCLKLYMLDLGHTEWKIIVFAIMHVCWCLWMSTDLNFIVKFVTDLTFYAVGRHIWLDLNSLCKIIIF